MNRDKFFSFEMIFGSGEKAMGNFIGSYGPITNDQDIEGVELMIRQSLNASNVGYQTHIDVVTLTNWKSL